MGRCGERDLFTAGPDWAPYNIYVVTNYLFQKESLIRRNPFILDACISLVQNTMSKHRDTVSPPPPPFPFSFHSII